MAEPLEPVINILDMQTRVALLCLVSCAIEGIFLCKDLGPPPPPPPPPLKSVRNSNMCKIQMCAKFKYSYAQV